MWKKKLRLGKALYLLARYLALLYIVLVVVQQFSHISLEVSLISIQNHSIDII